MQRKCSTCQTKAFNRERACGPCPFPAGETMVEPRKEKQVWLQPAPSCSLPAPLSGQRSSALLKKPPFKHGVLILSDSMEKLQWFFFFFFGKLRNETGNRLLNSPALFFSFSSWTHSSQMVSLNLSRVSSYHDLRPTTPTLFLPCKHNSRVNFRFHSKQILLVQYDGDRAAVL